MPLFNRGRLKDTRRELRTRGTPAEAALWRALKNRQLGGRRFRRQFSVGRYVLDFYCPAERLAVELDGAWHARPEASAYDAERDRYFGDLGIRVLRFENRLVFECLEEVLEEIARHFGAG
jgi:very-short-patch-repair endonuclease